MLCSSLSFAWSKFIGLFQHKSPESKYRISKGNDDYTKEYGDKTEEEFTVIPTEQKPKKEKLDIRDFMFSGQIDQQLLYKPPGSISGRAEFIIENCKV